jgi:FixJ family two-component response regulator
MAHILFVDDDPTVGAILHDTLFRMGHTPYGASNIPEALGVLQRESLDLIILDHRMPGMTGLEFLEYLREEGSDVPVIMLTGHGSIEHAVAAIKAGAVDYITKPVRADQLEVAVSAALELSRLRRENESLRREVMALRHERQIIGDSPQIRQMLNVIATAAPHPRDRPPAGRVGHRQGTGGPCAPRAEPAARPPLHPAQLRRDPGEPRRVRPLRAREGRLHRCPQARRGRLRARRRWHPAPRRDLGDAPGPPGQAAARLAGAAVRAGGRHEPHHRRRAHRRDHQSRPRAGVRRREVPPGPLL